MCKKEFLNILKDIKKFFIMAGIKEEEYDKILEEFRIVFPSGNENIIKLRLEDYYGNSYEEEESLQEAYAFNCTKLYIRDNKFYNTKPVIVFPKNNIDSSKYFVFIHEFIHYIAYVYKENEKNVLFGSGIDLSIINKETKEVKENSKVVLLNESITTLLSYYICEKKGYPLVSKTVRECRYNKIVDYLSKSLGNTEDNYIKLLYNILSNNKKETIKMFTSSDVSEKQLYKNILSLQNNNLI